jgi:hypothetical protein
MTTLQEILKKDDVFAAVDYKDQSLLDNVKKAADKKFGTNRSYVKNLWILREYKKRGGKVKYSGKRPSSDIIKKNVQKDVERIRREKAKGGVEVDLSGIARAVFFEQEEILLAHLIEIDEEVQDLASDLIYLSSTDYDTFEEYICEDDLFETQAKDNSDKISEVYKKYHEIVNMGYEALKKWAENPCSHVASLSRGPINRNLRLLSKKRDEWTMSDVRSANRTISFVSRMKGAEQGNPTKSKDGKSCPSKRDISLKNWAYSP